MVGDAVCWLGGKNQLAGIQLRPCSGILLAGLHFPPICSTRLSTDLRVLSAGTRDFCFSAVLPETGPFSLHTSLLRRKLSCLERTLEHLCSVQEKDALTACMKERKWRPLEAET